MLFADVAPDAPVQTSLMLRSLSEGHLPVYLDLNPTSVSSSSSRLTEFNYLRFARLLRGEVGSIRPTLDNRRLSASRETLESAFSPPRLLVRFLP